MDLTEAIIGRRSVREYTSQAVDEPTISGLIEAAIHAPSAVNQQRWTFTVVRDRAMLDRISHAAKAHMLAAMPGGRNSGHFQSLLSDANYLRKSILDLSDIVRRTIALDFMSSICLQPLAQSAELSSHRQNGSDAVRQVEYQFLQIITSSIMRLC